MQGDDEELERERLMVLAAVEAGEVQMEAPVEWGLIGLGVALESIRPLVASMHFMVVHRNRFPALVIGDQPVVLSPPPGHSPLSGYAFGTAGVSIAMPLSPDALLLIVNEEHDGQVFAFAPDRDQRPSLMRDWAVSANIGSIASSSRLVFGRTHGALEASLLCLEPEERTARGGSMVSGVPRQWAPYVRDGVHVEYDDED